MDTVGIDGFRDIGMVIYDKYAPRPFYHTGKFVRYAVDLVPGTALITILEQANAGSQGHGKGFPGGQGQKVGIQDETQSSDITSTDYGSAP